MIHGTAGSSVTVNMQKSDIILIVIAKESNHVRTSYRVYILTDKHKHN